MDRLDPKASVTGVDELRARLLVQRPVAGALGKRGALRCDLAAGVHGDSRAAHPHVQRGESKITLPTPLTGREFHLPDKYAVSLCIMFVVVTYSAVL